MSVNIVSNKDYVAGWLDSTVHDFLEVLSPGAAGKYALITCLDSNPDPASLRTKSPELKPLAGKVQVLGSGLLLLGGGEGLNFVVRAHGLAKFLLGFSLEQGELAAI